MESSPMRPRPMNPHVARLEGVAANDRRDVVESDRAVDGVGSVQRREEHRTATDGFMLTMLMPPPVQRSN